MLTLFLLFIITKGALTLYNGITIGRGAVRGGDTAQEQHGTRPGENPSLSSQQYTAAMQNQYRFGCYR